MLFNRVIEAIKSFFTQQTRFVPTIGDYQLKVAPMFDPETLHGSWEPLWVVQAPASEEMPIPMALLVRNEVEALTIGEEMSQDFPEVFVFHGGRLVKTFRPRLPLYYIPGAPRA